MSNEEDLQLMEKIAAGDSIALRHLYDRYKDPLMSFLFRLSGDRHEAEDSLQEVFLRVWRAARDFVPAGKVSAFLYKIAQNTWINEAKRARRRPWLLSQRAKTEEDPPESSAESLAFARTLAPAQELLQKELRSEIEEAVLSLPEKERVVFVLAHTSELGYAEISEVVGIPVGTVKSRMFSATERLRERLKKYLQHD